MLVEIKEIYNPYNIKDPPVVKEIPRTPTGRWRIDTNYHDNNPKYSLYIEVIQEVEVYKNIWTFWKKKTKTKTWWIGEHHLAIGVKREIFNCSENV